MNGKEISLSYAIRALRFDKRENCLTEEQKKSIDKAISILESNKTYAQAIEDVVKVIDGTAPNCQINPATGDCLGSECKDTKIESCDDCLKELLKHEIKNLSNK